MGDLGLSDTITIKATGTATLEHTLPLPESKIFAKIFRIGQVPVPVSGEFAIDAKLQSAVSDSAQLIKELGITPCP